MECAVTSMVVSLTSIQRYHGLISGDSKKCKGSSGQLFSIFESKLGPGINSNKVMKTVVCQTPNINKSLPPFLGWVTSSSRRWVAENMVTIFNTCRAASESSHMKCIESWSLNSIISLVESTALSEKTLDAGRWPVWQASVKRKEVADVCLVEVC